MRWYSLDAMTVIAVLQAVYGEGFDIGDTFTASVAGTITGALSDDLVMSDTMAAALQLVASLSEGLTFADVFTATVQAGVITGSLSEERDILQHVHCEYDTQGHGV